MSKLYCSNLPRKVNYSITSESKDSFIRLEIAKDISNYCTKPLLISLCQMNKDITRFIMSDIIAKRLEQMPTFEQKNTDKNMEPTQSLSPEENSEDIESIIDDIENLPTDAKKLVKKLVVQKFGMMGIGHISQENEIAKKINEEHITNYLDGAKEQMQNDYKERHEKKIYCYSFDSLGFFIAVILILGDKPDILEKIIMIIPLVQQVKGLA